VVDRVLTSRSSIYYRHVDVSAEEAGREHDEKLLSSFRGYRNESQLTSFLESNGL
jgi:hypothetical protein